MFWLIYLWATSIKSTRKNLEIFQHMCDESTKCKIFIFWNHWKKIYWIWLETNPNKEQVCVCKNVGRKSIVLDDSVGKRLCWWFCVCDRSLHNVHQVAPRSLMYLLWEPMVHLIYKLLQLSLFAVRVAAWTWHLDPMAFQDGGFWLRQNRTEQRLTTHNPFPLKERSSLSWFCCLQTSVPCWEPTPFPPVCGAEHALKTAGITQRGRRAQ